MFNALQFFFMIDRRRQVFHKYISLSFGFMSTKMFRCTLLLKVLGSLKKGYIFKVKLK